ncbi:TPA: hypothetical protein NDT34_003956 [Citrobacter freundii]|uniref:Replication protein n=1 Tax=Citrobacter freundii TaxID=546 RepID=A0AAP9TVI8_CITFR|nr:hypothetical protein [Citrobacter freundii]EKV4145683.1 hypothetical protein [Citrobacter freundii]ELO3996791.1 hypothetical protein [Citrobacter freundii]NTY49397.1 hypothetical protein [Citrobacter freundii]QLV30445.1 hypothetical protein HV178_10830 [Citrobacter freundii]QLW83794.1 hypothetical protein HV151_10265 [Citrobacter freundii]
MKRSRYTSHISAFPELEKVAKAISKAMPRFETIDQTLAENVIRVKALRSFGMRKAHEECIHLANTLEECVPEEPCGSMACSLCQRNRRLRFVQKWGPYIKTHQEDYVAVTLIFYADKHSASELSDWEYSKFKQRVLKVMQRIGFKSPIIGGFEMDYHNLTHDKKQSHWLPHLHLLMPNEPEKLEMLRQYMLRKKNHLAREGKRNRPMRIDVIKNVELQMSYCITGIWMEYLWFINADNKLKKSMNPRRIKSACVYAKSLVKLDRLSDGMLTFAVNVQVG